MDCGGVFVKYVLFIFNILFVVCGILLIVFGSIMLSHIGEFDGFEQTFQAHSVPIVIVVLGCVVFIIAFLGCCGAIRENSCCTMTYSVFMFVLFLCQLALIIYVWCEREKFLADMKVVVSKIWEQRQTDQKVMDALQLSFNCCGKNTFLDYYNETIPKSCCGPNATSCSKVEAMLKPGCTTAFENFWKKNIDIIRYAGLGVAAVELIAFIFACCLANQVRNNIRRSNY
ncbi:23 kDa integral membrane protein-like [Teleopsis dalmanni]|uniref:23 kDa integral membrane protein-like n=1 Tax=Teleopsis dalmanni TaxID=139649 RepID=UPI0018CFC1D6|nr:23 kDa integral membrane protein-like [Teleopsis dalmanni]